MENKITDINEGFKVVRNQSEAQKDCPITHIYDFNEIETKLLDDSFKIKRIWKDHIFIYDIDNYKKHIYIKDKYWCNTTNEEIQQLSKELGWHTMVIAKF
jgi:ADP-dependent phosphofructokinase/glucokinase